MKSVTLTKDVPATKNLMLYFNAMLLFVNTYYTQPAYFYAHSALRCYIVGLSF